MLKHEAIQETIARAIAKGFQHKRRKAPFSSANDIKFTKLGVKPRWLIILNHLTNPDPVEKKKLYEVLSISQINSLRLIVEWLEAQYNNPILPGCAWEMLDKSTPDDRYESYKTQQFTEAENYKYDALLFKLFIMEIGSMSIFHDLQLLRRQAAESAACQKLSFLYVVSNSESSKRANMFGDQIASAIKDCEWFNNQDMRIRFQAAPMISFAEEMPPDLSSQPFQVSLEDKPSLPGYDSSLPNQPKSFGGWEELPYHDTSPQSGYPEYPVKRWEELAHHDTLQGDYPEYPVESPYNAASPRTPGSTDPCAWLSPQEKQSVPHYMESASICTPIFGGQLTATIEPCAWLSPEEKKGLPRYLWDTVNDRTIDTTKSDSTPQYAVISHTWGRWRKGKKGEGVRIPGVNWVVPENSRFNVLELPRMLKRLSARRLGKIQYIWLDLLCIPQEQSPIMQEEVAKQAAVFSSASRAVIWLNDIRSWDGLQDTLRWLALDFLLHCSDDPGIGFKDMRDRLGQKPSTGFHPPPSWLTSLWTLQEACLRPDMWLANERWEILTIDGRTPVSLDCMAALTFASGRMCKCGEGTGHLAKQLRETLEGASMHGIWKLDQASILQLANGRYVRNNRAEAIMSILGATEWHKKKTRKGSNLKDELLFDSFAFEFVQEVRQKFGGLFFVAHTSKSEFHNIQTINPQPVGTLLPFSRIKPVKAGNGEWEYIPIEQDRKYCHSTATTPRRDDPTIKTWKLNSNGTVEIIDATIVYSTFQQNGYISNPKSDITATIYCSADHHQDNQDPSGVSGYLGKWMTRRFPQIETHAVFVSHFNGQKLDRNGQFMKLTGGEGIILQRVSPNSNVWGKIGDFVVDNIDKRQITTYTVRWVVY